MDNRNNNTTKKKNWLITLVTILFLAAVGAGVYLMIAGPEEQQATESLEKTSFSEREYQGGGGVSVAIDKEEEEPVSYTHLRAHETRHDLVCRLLLEKKKYTSPSPRDKRQSRMPSSA